MELKKVVKTKLLKRYICTTAQIPREKVTWHAIFHARKREELNHHAACTVRIFNDTQIRFPMNGLESNNILKIRSYLHFDNSYLHTRSVLYLKTLKLDSDRVIVGDSDFPDTLLVRLIIIRVVRTGQLTLLFLYLTAANG